MVPESTPPGRRRVAAVLVAGVLVALAATAGVVTAQSGPTVRVTETTVDPGETTTVEVVLSSASDGLAGYELALSLSGTAASVVDAEYPDAFGLTTDPSVTDDGQRLRLEAADVDGRIEAGATDVRLATVTLRGKSAGTVELRLDPVQFDADGGREITVDTRAGTAFVGTTPTATPTTSPTGPASPTVGTETPSTSLPGFGVTAVLLAVVALAGVTLATGRSE